VTETIDFNYEDRPWPDRTAPAAATALTGRPRGLGALLVRRGGFGGRPGARLREAIRLSQLQTDIGARDFSHVAGGGSARVWPGAC
jgi:hypothetical protein